MVYIIVFFKDGNYKDHFETLIKPRNRYVTNVKANKESNCTWFKFYLNGQIKIFIIFYVIYV